MPRRLAGSGFGGGSFGSGSTNSEEAEAQAARDQVAERDAEFAHRRQAAEAQRAADIGSNFVRLGDTSLAPALTEPPPLPASAVDDSLAWLLVAIPLGSAVGVDNVPALVNGDVYLGTGLPACDSSYQVGQVRKIVDNLEQVRTAGLKSSGVTNARELGTAGDVRTCAAQINLSNGSSDPIIYVIERTRDQLTTTLQAQTQ